MGRKLQAIAYVPTNLSGQVYLSVSSASSTAYQITTQGWIDRRGQDA